MALGARITTIERSPPERMSLMAGVIRRRPESPSEESIARQLRSALSRLHDSRVEVMRGDRHCFFKCDFGAFGAPGVWRSADGSVSLVCGDPLMTHNVIGNRLEDLKALHGELDRGNTASLRETRGTFTLAHFDAASTSLTLAVDRIGIRPLYFWISRDHVVFASALRILEAVAEVPRDMDVQGVTEEAAFGFPLGDRTPYSSCKLLRSGEVLIAGPSTVTRSLYARWDEIALSTESEEARAKRVYEAFSLAVRRRLRDDSSAFSFLTGGLDSRCIVSELRRQGASLYSFCFGQDGSQDLIFAAQFAEVIGSVHRRVPVPLPGAAPYPSPDVLPLDVQRTRMVWGGDGGSVGLGHVYLTSSMIESTRSGDIPAAIRAFCEHNHVRVPSRILARGMPDPDSLVHSAMEEELMAMHCEDPGRALFLFLLHNDQRRHLSKHFENLDLHQWELHLPFFDSDVLSAIIATPIDFCLGHHLYNRVLRCFPPTTMSVPWQAYPDHEPCPLPIAPHLRYQWRAQDDNPRHQQVRRELLANARRMLRAPRFPAALLDRRSVRAAYWLTRFGIRDYQYVLGVADIFESHWRSAQHLARPDAPAATSYSATNGTRARSQ